MNTIKKYSFLFIIILIMMLGILLRLKVYVFTRSLWLDESYIFDNIYYKNFLDLFFELDYRQSAPPLFLIAEKLIVCIFGINELALRFFPFICSIIAVPAFFVFSKIFLKNNVSIILANILFALNIQLLYYSQELKQYSSDVLCFMILFILLNKLSVKDFNKKHIVLYSIITTLFSLLSIPTYFIIAGWNLREIIYYKTKYLKTLFISNLAFFVSTIVYGICTAIPQHEIFMKYHISLWAPGFISLDMSQNLKLLFHNIEYFLKPNNIIIFAILIFMGIFLIVKNYKNKEVLLFLCTVLAIFAFSAAKIYPIYERVALYTVPILLVLLTKIIDIVSNKRKILSIFILIFFIISVKEYNFAYIKKCYNSQILSTRFSDDYPNPKELMKILKNNYKPDDIIIINRWSLNNYFYYKLYHKFNPNSEIFTEYKNVKTKQEYIQELEEITKPEKNYFFFFSTDYFPDKYELNGLKEWKTKYQTLFEKTINDSYILYLKKL